jgi:predicted TIM-barrel fold metal-dependent hydrolase
MHVVDLSFPLSSSATYTPKPHTLHDAKAFYSRLGIQNLVLVQPSIYGTDNSCLLSTLKAIGATHGRGILEIDPAKTSETTLREYHSLGARGVRINLKSSGIKEIPPKFAEEVLRYAELIRPLNWSLHFHVSMDMVPALTEIVPDLGVKLCIDHFGSPDLPPTFSKEKWESEGPWALSGFSHLMDLLRTAKPGAYVKISAPYRISSDPNPEMLDIGTVSRVLLKEVPERCVFATDWPHTRFEHVNVANFVEKCLEWAEEIGGEDLVDRLFRRNAEELLEGSPL